jgi:fido (protein-threonine AMPylation protein)
MPGIDHRRLLELITRLRDEGFDEVSSSQLIERSGAGAMTVKRLLARLWSSGELVREGQARATRYRLPGPLKVSAPALPPYHRSPVQPRWSAAALGLREELQQPLGSRSPVTYRRGFVEDYRPNDSALLPAVLAKELAEFGRMQGQQPAGTYARKVLEQLLIDLSWSSSRLEGNRYSRLDTEELFKNGLTGEDNDAVMLLNHKNAIEFMVDAVPEQGLSMGIVRNLHAVLMRDLLVDTDGLGAIRRKVVNISDTVYFPAQVPSLLAEMLERILDTARLVKNPIEAAFFLWVNIAYLQPFEDGNKRTSRLAANIPLMLYNRAPLAFLDVDRGHYRDNYAEAMVGVYERQDVSLAVDLFDWTYRRSCAKYAVVLEAMSAPDPLRLRYREALNEAIGLVVRDRQTLADALEALQLGDDKAPGLAPLLREELRKLEAFNCARYRVTMGATEAWIAAGRPA